MSLVKNFDKVLEVHYGNRNIFINILFEKRKTLSISVYPDKREDSKLPFNKSQEELEKVLQKRKTWIFRQVDYFDQIHPIIPERTYTSGETHYYLGRPYRLKVQEGEPEQVKLIGKFFRVMVPIPTSEKVRTVLYDWYIEYAKDLFKNRIGVYWEYFNTLGVSEPEIKVRYMKKRWGSCSSKGKITLNVELVKTPVGCIDYVIVHEICHLVYLAHNRSFYRLLEKILPDWKERKSKLEKATRDILPL